MPSALVHARVPTNYITLVCNCFFFAGCIIAFGLFLVRQCATRALQRELLTILGIDDAHNYDPTLEDELKYIFLGRNYKADPEDSALMHQLYDKLDLANLLRDFELIYEKVIGKRPKNHHISVVDQQEDDNRQILYSSMARSTLKDESEIDVMKFDQEEAKRKAQEKELSIASWDIDNYLKQTVAPQSFFDGDCEKLRDKIAQMPQSEQLDMPLEQSGRKLMEFSRQNSSLNTESVHKLPELTLQIVGESPNSKRPNTKLEDESSPTSYTMKMHNRNLSPANKPQHRYLDPTYSSSSRNYQTLHDRTQVSSSGQGTSTAVPASQNNLNEM